MRVLVLGGDGYLGWPAALRFSAAGHQVAVVDSFIRRRYDDELGTPSLTPVQTLDRRVARWQKLTGLVIDVHVGDLTGDDGEYGTPDIDIEEGWLDVTHHGRTDRLPFPKQPGSFYHLSKVHDSHNIMFCCRAWGLRAIDLNQGVVYGSQTEQTAMDPELSTRFDYDGVFGTVLNRFAVQAVAGRPLTVYGAGGQTRGFLNILDTMRCLELAVDSPAEPGEFRVFNQFTESFSVLQLAELVASRRANEIRHIENPRVEKDQHYYRAANDGLLRLGLKPHLLDGAQVDSMIELAELHRDRIDLRVIAPYARWHRQPPMLADACAYSDSFR